MFETNERYNYWADEVTEIAFTQDDDGSQLKQFHMNTSFVLLKTR